MAETVGTPTGEVTRYDVDFRGPAGLETYPAFVGANPTRPFARHLAALDGVATVVIIADANTAEILGPTYDAAFISAGLRTIPLTVPAGEDTKSWAVAGALLDALGGEALGADDLVVALGGGTVIDLAGFVAATYRRGVRFAAVPTTLLGMVDAALGGKSALNLTAGKNLVGARRRPEAVLMDIDALVTLSDDEYRNGLAEAVKMAVLDGDEALGWLESNADSLLTRDDDAVAELIARAIETQSRVEQAAYGPHSDHALSLGHTMGYALERLAGYGNLAHGMAVADGLRFALVVASRRLELDPSLVDRTSALLDRFGFPAHVYGHSTLNIGNAMRADKKVAAAEIRLILPDGQGAVRLVTVEEDDLFEFIRDWAGRERYHDYEFEAKMAAREAAEAEAELAELEGDLAAAEVDATVVADSIDLADIAETLEEE